MKSSWMTLLRQQRAAKFEAVAGATASVVLPIADRLITEIAGRRLPHAVRELEIHALGRNQLSADIRLRKPAWLPRISVKLQVEHQPEFPRQPVLVLRLLSHGALASLAGPAARFFSAFPSWIQMDGNLVRVDLAELLREYDASDVLSYVRRAEVTTRKGAIVLTLDATVA